MTDNLEPPRPEDNENGQSVPPVQPPVPPVPPTTPPPPPSPYAQPESPYSQPPSYGQQPPQQPPQPGYPTPPPAPPQMGTYYSNQQGYSASGPKNDPFAITAMTVGIVGVPLMCCCSFISFVMGIIATVFGALSMQRIKKSQGALGGNGMAIAGLVLGIGLIVVSIVLVVISLASGSWDTNYYSDL